MNWFIFLNKLLKNNCQHIFIAVNARANHCGDTPPCTFVGAVWQSQLLHASSEAWERTYRGGSLPAAARPFNPPPLLWNFLCSGCCPSCVNVRAFDSTSFISPLLFRLLAGTEGWSDGVRSVPKDGVCWNKEQQWLTGETHTACFMLYVRQRQLFLFTLWLDAEWFLFALRPGHFTEMLCWVTVLFYYKSLDNGRLSRTECTCQMYIAYIGSVSGNISGKAFILDLKPW